MREKGSGRTGDWRTSRFGSSASLASLVDAGLRRFGRRQGPGRGWDRRCGVVVVVFLVVVSGRFISLLQKLSYDRLYFIVVIVVVNVVGPTAPSFTITGDSE